MRKFVPMFAITLVLAACGANQATPSPTVAPTPSAQAVNVVSSAVNALKTQHDAWQFTVTTYESGNPNFSRMIEGTQTSKSPTAVSFTVTQPGKPDMRYIRLGTDTWNDTGSGTYTASKSSDNYVNLAFQAFYMDTLVAAPETSYYEYDVVGTETVNGVATTHYRLADTYLQNIIADTPGLSTTDWAADVWVDASDGSLVELMWGPQSLDKAQDQMGLNYVVTAVDCECPIVAPQAGRS